MGITLVLFLRCHCPALRVHNHTVLPSSHNSSYVYTNDSAYTNISATVGENQSLCAHWNVSVHQSVALRCLVCDSVLSSWNSLCSSTFCSLTLFEPGKKIFFQGIAEAWGLESFIVSRVYSLRLNWRSTEHFEKETKKKIHFLTKSLVSKWNTIYTIPWYRLLHLICGIFNPWHSTNAFNIRIWRCNLSILFQIIWNFYKSVIDKTFYYARGAEQSCLVLFPVEPLYSFNGLKSPGMLFQKRFRHRGNDWIWIVKVMFWGT